MKKIRNRSIFALIIAGAMVLGMLFFIIRLWNKGGDWVMLPANRDLFYEGVFDKGTVTDRNGVVLASTGEGVRGYAEDGLTRTACLHAVGDYAGFIGTGALTAFREKLSGYDFINGAASLSGNGETVALTIDSELNKAAYSALNGRRGAVLVTDYRTGEILCDVSSPAYDPNFEIDVTDSRYEGVYLNRALSSPYVPGSVFKIVTLTAAVENIEDLSSRSFNCAGSVTVGGELINCTGVHGNQSIEDAFANSCNCAFSELAQELGGELLAEYAEKLGLTEALEFSGIPVAEGRFDAAPKGSGTLSWSAIGQSTDLVTPYAMVRLVGAIANGGTVQEPTILMKRSGGSTELLDSDTADRLSEMMNYNVAHSYGESLVPNATLHAKTGTAEVGDGSSHAWFVGFISGASEDLAFAVIVENGGGGLASAAPVAASVINAAIQGD